jgi:uncharacterized protein YodC (DUF2158 family)
MTRRNSRHEPPEVSALFNPALISLLLWRAASAHTREAQHGLPYVYGPIVVTISLYPEVRRTLSRNVTTKLATWIVRIDALQPLLRSRIVDMVPLVNEGTLFGLSHNVLRLVGSEIQTGSRGPAATIRGGSSDMEDAQRSAAYLGRWFARAGSPATVCALLGITP